MDVERIAAFAMDGAGGNPAGVVIGPMPSAAEMQRIAAEVGYSETVFAQRQGDGFRARYFAPGAEVPFCGHATIALGAALGAHFGAKVYPLTLNEASISVEALEGANGWEAELQSPATSHRAIEAGDLAEVLALFGWDHARLDPDIAPIYADLPPEAPSFIMRVCGFGFCNPWFRFGQAHRAR
ncbi:MAG: PhzF family phenazine biosynthesis protein, partial [Dinoroseobacter sp.]